MDPTHRKHMNHQATWETNSIDHNTLLQNQNESSFSFKERKEKYNKKETMLFTHTLMERQVKCLEDRLPQRQIQ